MRIRRPVLSFVLAFFLVFNPMIYEAALWAEGNDSSATMDNAATTMTEGNAKVQAMEEVKLSSVKKFVLGIGSWLKGKSWNYYKDKIEDANQKIREAKEKSAQANQQTQDNKGTHDAAVSAGTGMKSTINQTAGAKAELQKALMETGKSLQEIAQTLKLVGVGLIAVGLATSWLFGAGAFLATIGKVLYAVASALDSAGKTLYEMGQKGATDDKDFFNVVTSAVKGYVSGYAQAGSYASSGSAAITALNTATNGKASWIDKVSAGLGAMGSDGKKAQDYVNKAKDGWNNATSYWDKIKSGWSTVKGWFGSDDKTQTAGTPTSSAAGSPEPAVTTTTTSNDASTPSGQDAGTGVSNGDENPTASNDANGSFIGGGNDDDENGPNSTPPKDDDDTGEEPPNSTPPTDNEAETD